MRDIRFMLLKNLNFKNLILNSSDKNQVSIYIYMKLNRKMLVYLFCINHLFFK